MGKDEPADRLVRCSFCAFAFAIVFAILPSMRLTAAESGRPLDSILEDLRNQGVKLIYSSALVTPEMKADVEPSGASMTERLQSVLKPHGLSPVPGPDGSMLVVRTPADTSPAGIVSHIKVLSDKIEDVSSMNAWLKSCIKPGMTDEKKALAVWASVVKFH